MSKFLSFQNLSPIYIISLTCQAAWANKFHCQVQPPLQLTNAFIENSVKQHMPFYEVTLSLGQNSAHNTSKSGWEEDPSLHVWQPQWKICLYSPQLSPTASPNPWVLLPVLHAAAPHSFPELLCSSHSWTRSFCKTNPFITKQFHPFLDREALHHLLM